MARQLHIRLDDRVYEAVAEYTVKNNSSIQDFVSTAVIQFLKLMCHKKRSSIY